MEDPVVKVDGQVSAFDVWQGLAGGQVVDGDFVALPAGVGENDSADRRGGTCTRTGGAAIAVGYAGLVDKEPGSR